MLPCPTLAVLPNLCQCANVQAQKAAVDLVRKDVEREKRHKQKTLKLAENQEAVMSSKKPRLANSGAAKMAKKNILKNHQDNGGCSFVSKRQQARSLGATMLPIKFCLRRPCTVSPAPKVRVFTFGHGTPT